MRHLAILACVMSGLLWLGGPAGSEEKPAVKKDTFEGAEGKKRAKAARIRSIKNLEQIGLALINHADSDANSLLPAVAIYDKDDKALLSWRVTLLPYLDQKKLYDEFKLDEAWDSAHNKKLLAKMPKIYACPVGAAKANHTFYQVFVGKAAGFEGKKGLRFPAAFTDGTSNTILVVEAGEDVPWTKPADLVYEAGKKLPVVGGVFANGFHAVMADGGGLAFPKTLKPKTLEAYITRNGGEKIGKDD